MYFILFITWNVMSSNYFILLWTISWWGGRVYILLWVSNRNARFSFLDQLIIMGNCTNFCYLDFIFSCYSDLMNTFHTKIFRSRPRHPECNGRVERVNRTIQDMLYTSKEYFDGTPISRCVKELQMKHK